MSASAPPKAAVTPTVLKATPVHSSTTSARPVRHMATDDPDAPPDVLLVDEPREERDEERRGELDEERDADGQVLDRDEVEPLHERDADETERDEEDELASSDPQPRRRDHEEEGEEEDRGARVADLRELERGEAQSRGRPSTRSR